MVDGPPLGFPELTGIPGTWRDAPHRFELPSVGAHVIVLAGILSTADVFAMAQEARRTK